MKSMKLGVILLALLLAGMAMVPIVNAAKILPSNEILEMKYLQDSPANLKIDTSIPDTVTEYSLVTVDPDSFIKDADSTKQVSFKISGTDYTILLSEKITPIDKDAKIFIKGVEGEKVAKIPRIKTYTGNVLGAEKGEALFTVADTVLLGTISLGNDTYFIDQCAQMSDGKVLHVLYNSTKEIKRGTPRPFDVTIRDEPTHISAVQDTVADANLSTYIPQSKSKGATLASTSVGLLAVYDTQFASAYPNPTAEISNTISQVNNAFSPADVTLSITSYYQDSTLTSTTAYTLLADFRTNYQDERDQTNSDLAILFTGKQLGNEIGGAFSYVNGDPAKAYAVAQMVSDGDIFSGSLYQRSVLTTHEIGHNFGADHENASSSPTWARAYHWVEWFIFDKYTAMWSLWQGDNGQIEFSNSNNHGDSTHNNIQRIQDTKATVAAYQ